MDIIRNSNRAALQAKVLLNTGRPDKAVVAIDGLNEALLELAKDHLWEELRTPDSDINVPIAAADISLVLPAKAYHIIELRLVIPDSPIMSYPMVKLRKKEFVHKFPNVAGSTISGRPYWCYQQGQTLYLDRKSDSAYTIRITAYAPNQFVDDNSVCDVFGSDNILIAYATAQVYKSIQMYTDATYWMGEFRTKLKSLYEFQQNDIGLPTKATGWVRPHPTTVNEPWRDPFSGHDSTEYR